MEFGGSCSRLEDDHVDGRIRGDISGDVTHNDAGRFNAGIADDSRCKDRAGAAVQGPVGTGDSAAADASALTIASLGTTNIAILALDARKTVGAGGRHYL